MTRLVIGVMLWSMVHFVPALAPGFKQSILKRSGEYPYKGAFTLLMVISLFLIISGWSSLTPVEPDVLNAVYTAPEWGGHAAAVLILIGFILFLAPYPANNIKRMLRHPQLVGVVGWGVGHLLAIGTARAIVLFGGLTVWALIEILLINRRDGQWVKPDKAPLKNDVALIVFSILAYLAFLYTHHLLFGGTNLIS
ncbi:MAG: NnrU family protein [Xanthomonadales bacterium]|nr:NnrU family protein [Xanthomonadales bacterium]MDH4021262.1 NnrU family protein [Xanthomonadales bacterium]